MNVLMAPANERCILVFSDLTRTQFALHSHSLDTWRLYSDSRWMRRFWSTWTRFWTRCSARTRPRATGNEGICGNMLRSTMKREMSRNWIAMIGRRPWHSSSFSTDSFTISTALPSPSFSSFWSISTPDFCLPANSDSSIISVSDFRFCKVWRATKGILAFRRRMTLKELHVLDSRIILFCIVRLQEIRFALKNEFLSRLPGNPLSPLASSNKCLLAHDFLYCLHVQLARMVTSCLQLNRFFSFSWNYSVFKKSKLQIHICTHIFGRWKMLCHH